ncbi:MAG TPA: 4-hydroxy-3-methylbut-2-enyl diphosphate reductase, partial [Bacteroidales bacterium]|nr:4-hydroxy-3-methylbut-2-enyl diphosphate reductase [Bacteroidales bacterium]
QEMQEAEGYVYILGKEGHAEVVGLMGQTGRRARVIQNVDDLKDADFSRPSRLYAQTTEDPEKLKTVAAYIEDRYRAAGYDPATMFKAHDTICRQVSNRGIEIREFAGRFDLVIFVSDPKSSNGKQLFEICLKTNRRSYFVTGPEDLKKEWFTNTERVGICGATSTPQWVMEAVRDRIREMS